MSFTTEIASENLLSDAPVHLRLLKAYYLAVPYIKGRLLEIGCGEGRGVGTLAPHSTSYLGIDKIVINIDMLKSKYPDKNFKAMVIPPFYEIADNSFDTIITFQVIEHIKNDRLFLEEIKRVLAPGGKCIITTPNKNHSLTRNPWHIREYKPSDLIALCEAIFSKVTPMGVAGSSTYWDYHEKNRKSIKKITRFDIFNLQYNLPLWALRLPYDILNRFNRNKLLKQNDSLVSGFTLEDYSLTDKLDESIDLFYLVEK